ncbi:unnamed protein product [Moneuplotes crassus]|uniref:Uncharacterized protein n=1 Tax=Euplotes crassus TaxID=5936 RepID=A0AAD1X892_EUPCR|nr:unnamed protein product [Moneuplotes crassus]
MSYKLRPNSKILNRLERESQSLAKQATGKKPFKGKIKDFNHKFWNDTAKLETFISTLTNNLHDQIGMEGTQRAVNFVDGLVNKMTSQNSQGTKKASISKAKEVIIIDPDPEDDKTCIESPPLFQKPVSVSPLFPGINMPPSSRIIKKRKQINHYQSKKRIKITEQVEVPKRISPAREITEIGNFRTWTENGVRIIKSKEDKTKGFIGKLNSSSGKDIQSAIWVDDCYSETPRSKLKTKNLKTSRQDHMGFTSGHFRRSMRNKKRKCYRMFFS